MMFWRILGKDMKKRRSINFILFLFITLASVFLSSSVNNIMVVTSAVNYYMDYANIADVTAITMGTEEKGEISDWIQNEADGVEDYGETSLILLKEDNLQIREDGTDRKIRLEKQNLYLGSMDADFDRVYDEDGKEFSLKSGEIAMGRAFMEKNRLEPGDCLIIKIGSFQKPFTIRLVMKDAAFGNEMSGMTRVIVNQSDLAQFAQCEGADWYGLHYVNLSSEDPNADAAAEDVGAFTAALYNQGFTTLSNTVTKSTYRLVYSFDMIIAALLIFIGICLILIAMLVLRFTLVFTMEEDYREIGIMKAVGLTDFAIKRIYLVKYLFLVMAGAVLGLGISIPVSSAMVKSVAVNMITEDSRANFGLNVICTAAIVLIVLLFCYRCTHRMDKISAISAIRGGQTGERFQKKAGISLYKRGRMPVPFFLGLNDMLSHVKRYLLLILTFCVSFILITIPLNTLNTMRSREMVEKFGINPDSAVYLEDIEPPEETYTNTGQLLRGMERAKQILKKEGYEADLTAIAIFFLPFYIEGDDEEEKNMKMNILTIQPIGDHPHYLSYDEGEEPVLENEIAISRPVLELYGWKIGDSIQAVVGGETKTFLITGTYTDYMQIGQSARLNSAINCEKERMFEYWSVMVDMDTDQSQSVLAEEIKRKFSSYGWSASDAQEIVDRNVGSIQKNLDRMLVPMTGMLCVLIMLITLLTEKLFIVREKGEVAMMKSVGFTDRTIRLWQVMRMIYVALFSMVLAVPVSLLSNQWILKPIFGIMGAEVRIQVNPWQVYGIYPGILLAGIIAATVAATRTVRKISLQEMNHVE